MVTPCGEAVHAVIGANARQLEICGRFWDVPMDLVSVVIPAYNSGNGSRQRSTASSLNPTQSSPVYRWRRRAPAS